MTEFRWISQFTAFRYRLVVRAAAALRPGRYTWLVEARDRNGQVMTVSRPQSFQVN